MTNSNKVTVFYRIIKAERGHPFAGLYAVEKVFYKGDSLLKKEIVHEWDLRIISEAVLAKLGGGDAYESWKLDHEIADLEAQTKEVEPRDPKELALNKAKLAKEMKFKPE